jgi:hypothetical protein
LVQRWRCDGRLVLQRRRQPSGAGHRRRRHRPTGFLARFQSASIAFADGAIDATALSIDIRLPGLDEPEEHWINLAVSLGTDGDLSASLSALQPEASCDPAHLVSLKLAGVAR